jgi:hypothetical protein
MALRVAEWFGFDLSDWSPAAVSGRADQRCPFLGATCTKMFSDRTRSGACSVSVLSVPQPVVICPNRLYSENYRILEDVATVAFGPGQTLIHPDDYSRVDHTGRYVVAFGKRFGKELKLPRQGGRGAYFVDWILARIGPTGQLAEFVALEIQTIDTTGTYRPDVQALRRGDRSVGVSKAGLNWENVNKRILPQIIYKGHVLRRENLCTKGLFFVCPTEVYGRIASRLGGTLLQYANLQPGSVTFMWYGLGPFGTGIRILSREGQFSTTVDQVALGFTAPSNLPPAGVYEAAIRRELG